jgi:hypothetical protein
MHIIHCIMLCSVAPAASVTRCRQPVPSSTASLRRAVATRQAARLIAAALYVVQARAAAAVTLGVAARDVISYKLRTSAVDCKRPSTAAHLPTSRPALTQCCSPQCRSGRRLNCAAQTKPRAHARAASVLQRPASHAVLCEDSAALPASASSFTTDFVSTFKSKPMPPLPLPVSFHLLFSRAFLPLV